MAQVLHLAEWDALRAWWTRERWKVGGHQCQIEGRGATDLGGCFDHARVAQETAGLLATTAQVSATRRRKPWVELIEAAQADTHLAYELITGWSYSARKQLGGNTALVGFTRARKALSFIATLLSTARSRALVWWTLA